MPKKPLPPCVPYNDLDLTRWKELGEVWTDSLWSIPRRDHAGGHRLSYHGNFVPQVATQTILRFSREKEIVLDLFLGSGTTAREALRRNRRCIGVELKPELAESVGAEFADKPDQVRVLVGDSSSPDVQAAVRDVLSEWGSEAADLVVMHPPYAGIIRFSELPECLSNAAGPEEFLERWREVVRRAWSLLKPDRFAILVIGDCYEKGELIPLGFDCMRVANEEGFRTKSIVVKNIEGNEVGKGKAANLWRYRALRGGFYVFKHEYVIVLQKFEKAGARRRPIAPSSTEDAPPHTDQ